MYHCVACGNLSPPKQPMIRFAVHREVPSFAGPRKEIAAEVPVCRRCGETLLSGRASLDDLRRRYAPERLMRLRAKGAPDPSSDDGSRGTVLGIKLIAPCRQFPPPLADEPVKVEMPEPAPRVPKRVAFG